MRVTHDDRAPVIPAKAGIQGFRIEVELDSGSRHARPE